MIGPTDYVRRALNVRRYHQHTTLEVDTVGKHSAGVALYLLALDPDCRKEAMVAAITHDLGEFEVGDLPAPTKRRVSAACKSELDALEDAMLHDLGFGVDLTDEEHALLKLCDCLDGLSFCVEEYERGNRSMRDVGDKYISYIQQQLDKYGGHNWARRANPIIYKLTKRWHA